MRGVQKKGNDVKQWSNFLCWIFGHRLYVHARPKEAWGKGIRWLQCSRCHGNYAINDRVKAFLPMDFELMDDHEWVLLKENRT